MIYIVEDDAAIRELEQYALQSSGYDVQSFESSESFWQAMNAAVPELVILDVMLPGLGGIEVLKSIRRQSSVPVLMLTARGDDVDRIVGLELGADDYLPKPFNPRELIARIRAVLRRGRMETGEDSQGNVHRIGDLAIDLAARHVSVAGKRIDLTTVEFDLLETLAQAAGTAFSREKLVRQVLKRPFSPFDRSLDVHVSNLRRKIGTYRDGSDRIKTVRGLGYILATPPEEIRS